MDAHSDSLFAKNSSEESDDNGLSAAADATPPPQSSAPAAAAEAESVVDCCVLCLVAPRDARVAIVPGGHHRFCASCADKVHSQNGRCPMCRTDICNDFASPLIDCS